jgi:hypothetical protein
MYYSRLTNSQSFCCAKVNKSTLSQLEYQQRILTSLELDPDTLNGAQYTWWYNPTNRYSLRLTKLGHKWFSGVAKISTYHVGLGDQMIYPKQLLQLERLFTAPYYIQTLKKLWVYSETDYIMLQLHGSDLKAYLDNLENQ